MAKEEICLTLYSYLCSVQAIENSFLIHNKHVMRFSDLSPAATKLPTIPMGRQVKALDPCSRYVSEVGSGKKMWCIPVQ